MHTSIHNPSPPVGAGSLPYNSYRAHLTQAGVAAPVATVFAGNTIGVIVWSYVAIGIYRGTLAGAFTVSKTHLSIRSVSTIADGVGCHLFTLERVDANTVEVQSGEIVDMDGAIPALMRLADGILNTDIEIQVDP